MSALQDLYALIPPEGYIPGHALPAVFARYERQRGAEILSRDERDALEAFGRENGDVRVDAGLLVGLMGQLLGAGEGKAEDEGKRESGRVTAKGGSFARDDGGSFLADRFVEAGRQLELAEADMSLLDDTQPPFTPTSTTEHAASPTEHVASPHVVNRTGGKPNTPTASHIPRRREAVPPSSYTPGARSTRRGSDPAESPRQAVRLLGFSLRQRCTDARWGGKGTDVDEVRVGVVESRDGGWQWQ